MAITQQFFGCYFFLSNDLNKYHFEVYNVIHVAQSLGGIFALLLFVFRAIGGYINKQIIIAKFIRSLFYVYKDEEEILKRKEHVENVEDNDIDDLKCIKFSFRDKFYSCRRKSDKQKIFKRGKEMVENEMNMFTMLQTMQKLKAAVTILVGPNIGLKKEIQKLYLQKQTIDINDQSNP